MLDKEKWAKDIKRASFRLYDSRPLDNTIVYGELIELHVGFQPATVVNLYSETKELADGKRVFPCFNEKGFVGVLDIGKTARTYMRENCQTEGFTVVVKPVGTRYANTIEPDCRVVDILIGEPWTQPEEAQEDPRKFLLEAMETTIAQSAQRSEERKSFFKKLLGKD
ncbi:MAG: hypothetical protein ACI4BI_04105 [Anaerotardibacter sp.]